MDILNILLCIIIFLILYSVILKIIRNRNVKFANIQEGLIGMVDDAEFEKVKNDKNFMSISSIQSMENKYAKLPIKDYCIKSSYNSATTGKTVNKKMIQYVLSRGCRFIDFEVFYIKKKDNFVPVVAESTDPNFKIFNTDNDMNLEECFSTIIGNSFSNMSPNKKDPLFVHLRIKTKDTNCYAAVAKLIDSILKPKLHEGEVTKDTKLSEIMGKIVIVIDKTIHRDYKDFAKCKSSDVNCFDISNYLNIESGSQNMNLFSLSQIEGQAKQPAMIKDDNVSTTSIANKVILPIDNSNDNPIMKKMILDYGSQIVAYRYNKVDGNLADCETFFNDNRGGIVPLSSAIAYFERVDKELKKMVE